MAIFLLVFQVLGYLGSMKNTEKIEGDAVQLSAFYFGFNLFLIIGMILFIVAADTSKKLKKRMEEDEIASLGNNNK